MIRIVSRRHVLLGLTSLAAGAASARTPLGQSGSRPGRPSAPPDVKGDGRTDDTVALQRAITNAARVGQPLDLSGGTFLVSSLSLPGGTTLYVRGTTFLGAGAAANTAILKVVGDGCRLIGDVTIDMRFLADRAFEIKKARDFFQQGTLSLRNARQVSTLPYNGGVLIDSCTNISIDHISARSYRQFKGRPGLFRALGCRFSDGIVIASVDAEDGDMATEFFASTNVKVDLIAARDITDNGLYLINATSNVYIKRIMLDHSEEGMVFNVNKLNANIHIENATINNSSNRALSLRTGGGYRIDQLIAVNGGIGQSSRHKGVDGLSIGCAYLSETNPQRRPLNLVNDRNVQIDSLHLSQQNPAGNFLMRVSGNCTGLKIGTLVAESAGANVGVLGAGKLSSPNIVINRLERRGTARLDRVEGVRNLLIGSQRVSRLTAGAAGTICP